MKVPPRAAALAAIAALWVAGLPRHVLGGDNGEFSTLFAEGGVAHPSGYPVYTLYLRAMSWLPLGAPARGAAVATMLLGLAALWVVERAARAWGASERGALAAMVLVGVSPLMWRLGTHAEVFALNVLVAASVLVFAAPGAPFAGMRRAAALGAVAGVGLGNHLSCALLAPVGLYGLWRAAKESSWRALPLSAAAALPGLASYASLWVVAQRPGDRLVWGACETWRGVLAHALREDYGVAKLSTLEGEAQPLSQLVHLATTLWTSSLGVGLLLALIGAVTATLDRARRPGHGALLAAFALAGPVFVARFNIPPTGLGAQVVERFHLLPLVLLSPFAALGFDELTQRAALGARAQALVIALAGVANAAAAWPAVRAEHSAVVETYLADTLRGAPPNAVILGTGDLRAFGFPYMQRALGMRRDVLVIDPKQLLFAHYRRRAERRLGRPLPAPRDGSLSSVDVVLAALSTGRPVCMTDVFSRTVPARFATWPEGTLIHVVPPGSQPPPLREVLARNDQWFSRARQRPVADEVDGWARVALEGYAVPWRALEAAAAAQGRVGVASAFAARARAWAP